MVVLEKRSKLGEQYELDLEDVRVRIPWDGRAPRTLTRVWKSLILAELSPEGAAPADPIQFVIFLKGSP